MYSTLFIVLSILSLLNRALSEPVSCLQNRGNTTSNGSTISQFIQRRGDKVCLRLQNKASLRVYFEGYELVTSSWPRSLENCTFALSEIAQSCISDLNFYGGVNSFEDVTYHLNNTVYPNDPIFHRLKHSISATVHSITTSTSATTPPSSSTPIPVAIALQAANNATAAITQLINHPDSIMAQEKAKKSTHHAAAAAAAAGLVWLASVLNSASSVIGAVISGAKPASDLGPSVDEVGAAEKSIEERQSHSVSDHSRTSHSSSASSSSSSTSLSGACSIRTSANAKHTTRSQSDSEILMKRRRPDPIKSLASCPRHPFPTPIKIPVYYSKKELDNSLRNQPKSRTQYDKIPKWYVAEPTCIFHDDGGISSPGFTLEKRNDAEVQDYYGIRNIDHVFEINLISIFLQSIIPSEISCEEMMDYLLGHSTVLREVRLQYIYNQLPTYDVAANPWEYRSGLIGIQKSINSMKSNVFKPIPNDGLNYPPTLQTFERNDNFDQQLQILQNLTLVFDVFNKPDVQKMFGETYLRLYQGFKFVDLDAENICVPSLGLSHKFSTWLRGTLADIGTDSFRWATERAQQMRSTFAADRNQITAIDVLTRSPLWSAAAFTLKFNPPYKTRDLVQAGQQARSHNDTCSRIVSSSTGTSSSIMSTSSTTSSTLSVATCGPVSLWSVPDFITLIPAGPPGMESFDFVYEKTQYPNLFQVGYQWTYIVTPGVLTQFTMSFLNATDAVATILSFESASCLSFLISDDRTISAVVISGILTPGLTGTTGYWLSVSGFGAGLSTCGSIQPNCAHAPSQPTPTPFTSVQFPATTSLGPASPSSLSTSSTSSFSTSSGPPLCLQTPFSTPEFVITIPQGQTAFSIFLADMELPGEDLWTFYNQYTYTESMGVLLDLQVALLPLAAEITSNSSSCLSYMVPPYHSISGDLAANLTLYGNVQQSLTTSAPYTLVINSFGMNYELGPCVQQAGCVDPPSPVLAPASTITITQSATGSVDTPKQGSPGRQCSNPGCAIGPIGHGDGILKRVQRFRGDGEAR